MNIQGKVAVVTGSGGKGCGRAIACRFAHEGASVVVSDINESGGLETVRRIADAGGQAAFCRTDVQVPEQMRNLIQFAEQTYGPLGIFVNNASGPGYRPDVPLEFWSETMQIELFGTMHGIGFAIDAMRRSGGGAIVNMGSISALWHGRTKPGSPSYDAAKSAVLRLTTGLAWLGEKERIRVNCFTPGWIATEEVRSYWETLTPEQRSDLWAPARLLELDEVADAVVRLATDESLAGRVLVWWSDDAPGLIPWCDPGYVKLDAITLR
ncbi:MAG TPA: SDR family oxidoreductase [Bryobacteraceae bacterium]|nr:SDR family oxidoreductase [Bryobacteraceae bacterium]